MSNYGSQDVKCPFYKGEDEKTIKCEGVVSPICVHVFKGTKKKALIKKTFCNADYEKCEHSKKLEQKYE